MKTCEFDMEQYLKQSIDMYLEAIGLTYKDLKKASTPFVVDEALTDADFADARWRLLWKSPRILHCA